MAFSLPTETFSFGDELAQTRNLMEDSDLRKKLEHIDREQKFWGKIMEREVRLLKDKNRAMATKACIIRAAQFVAQSSQERQIIRKPTGRRGAISAVVEDNPKIFSNPRSRSTSEVMTTAENEHEPDATNVTKSSTSKPNEGSKKTVRRHFATSKRSHGKKLSRNPNMFLRFNDIKAKISSEKMYQAKLQTDVVAFINKKLESEIAEEEATRKQKLEKHSSKTELGQSSVDRRDSFGSVLSGKEGITSRQKGYISNEYAREECGGRSFASISVRFSTGRRKEPLQQHYEKNVKTDAREKSDRRLSVGNYDGMETAPQKESLRRVSLDNHVRDNAHICQGESTGRKPKAQVAWILNVGDFQGLGADKTGVTPATGRSRKNSLASEDRQTLCVAKNKGASESTTEELFGNGEKVVEPKEQLREAQQQPVKSLQSHVTFNQSSFYELDQGASRQNTKHYYTNSQGIHNFRDTKPEGRPRSGSNPYSRSSNWPGVMTKVRSVNEFVFLMQEELALEAYERYRLRTLSGFPMSDLYRELRKCRYLRLPKYLENS